MLTPDSNPIASLSFVSIVLHGEGAIIARFFGVYSFIERTSFTTNGRRSNGGFVRGIVFTVVPRGIEMGNRRNGQINGIKSRERTAGDELTRNDGCSNNRTRGWLIGSFSVRRNILVKATKFLDAKYARDFLREGRKFFIETNLDSVNRFFFPFFFSFE